MNAPAGIRDMIGAYLALAPVSVANIRNVRTRIESAGGLCLPVTVNDSESNNAWICSPYTAYVRYAVEEIARLPGRRLMAPPLAALCRLVGVLLKRTHIDDAVAVNNWLLSTNCWPTAGFEDARSLIEECVARWPRHGLWFRSLNRRYTASWMEALVRSGCDLIPSRQVWLYDDLRGARRSANLRRDLALLQRWGNRRSPASAWNASDFLQAERLYAQLYLHKYSRLNPEYSAALLSAWSGAGLLNLVGYRGPDGALCAVVGTFELDGTLTAPIVGYDTSLPQSLGLYRVLMATVFERAIDTGQRVNLSAGAAEFKRLRGGQGEIEYSAVYSRHLPRSRRVGIEVLGGAARQVGEPFMRRNGL